MYTFYLITFFKSYLKMFYHHSVSSKVTTGQLWIALTNLLYSLWSVAWASLRGFNNRFFLSELLIQSLRTNAYRHFTWSEENFVKLCSDTVCTRKQSNVWLLVDSTSCHTLLIHSSLQKSESTLLRMQGLLFRIVFEIFLSCSQLHTPHLKHLDWHLHDPLDTSLILKGGIMSKLCSQKWCLQGNCFLQSYFTCLLIGFIAWIVRVCLGSRWWHFSGWYLNSFAHFEGIKL